MVLKVADLHPNDGQLEAIGVHANPRIITDEEYRKLVKSLREDNLTGVLQEKVINYNGEWIVLDGNMRLRALREVGIEEVQCLVVPEDADAKTIEKIIILSNSTFAQWDMDALANWDAPLADWGVDVPELTAEEKAEYSRKVESPIYEPTAAVAPSISECVDLRKYEELCSEIDGAEIDDEEKRFLKIAAARHIVFDYRNIAERYAHSPKEVQALMEKSALVIIDFGSAIEEGFVKMSKRLQTLIPEE